MRLRRGLLAGALALVTLAGTGAATGMASAAPAAGGTAVAAQITTKKTASAPDFGENVTIFDDTWTTAEIQAKFDEIHAKQVSNEMGSDRYGLYFMPGTYGSDEEPLQGKVGYYTEVAGLGASPGDVQINGVIEVNNQCFDDPDNPEFIGCFALNNFWRGMSNLTINVKAPGRGCYSDTNFWAVSQAVSMRRVDVKGGNLTLMDYCTEPAFASGGFIADSRAGCSSSTVRSSSGTRATARFPSGRTRSGTRSSPGDFTVGPAPADSAYPDPPYTTA